MFLEKIPGRVPLIPISVQAGFQSYLFDNPLEEITYIPCPLKYSQASIAFSVVGTSMEPYFLEGDILFSHEIFPENWQYLPIHPRDAYILHYGENYLVLKYLKRTKANSKLQLLSVNQREYPPHYISWQEIRNIWRVLGKEEKYGVWS
ncbi:MAG: S24 family peptidase [Bacteroidia bacterium]|nr:S24 family peptidase [Bacteroidia bacterium]MDW8158555.1 S24 family peptidase [Bacteroidia bacterium]